MEKATVIGLPLGLLSILSCLIFEGGDIKSIIGGPAFIIVIFGSLGAVMVSLPWENVVGGVKAVKKAILGVHMDFDGLISQIERLAGVARKDGLLALEKERESITDPLLKEAIKFAVDGLDPNLVSQILEARIDHKRHELMLQAKFWKGWGQFAPTVAIVGAVLGLIIVMQNLSNPDRIGPGIAVAFIATVYGVTSSNVIFLPLGGKLEVMSEHEGLYYDMIRLGVKDIQQGTSPAIIKSRLYALIDQEVVEEEA